MKLKYLYRGRFGFPWVTVIITVSCLWVSGLTFFQNDLFYVFGYRTPPTYFWQAMSGAFEHGSVLGGSTLTQTLPMHLGLNLLMILPLGCLVEKAIGSQNAGFILVSTWSFSSFLVQMLLWGMQVPISGVSAIGYSFGPIALYMLWRIFRMDKKAFIRQPIAWGLLAILLAMLFILNPLITGWQSFMLHLFGVVMGIIYLILFRRTLNVTLASYKAGRFLQLAAPWWVQLFWLLPASLIAITVAYWAGAVRV